MTETLDRKTAKSRGLRQMTSPVKAKDTEMLEKLRQQFSHLGELVTVEHPATKTKGITYSLWAESSKTRYQKEHLRVKLDKSHTRYASLTRNVNKWT